MCIIAESHAGRLFASFAHRRTSIISSHTIARTRKKTYAFLDVPRHCPVIILRVFIGPAATDSNESAALSVFMRWRKGNDDDSIVGKSVCVCVSVGAYAPHASDWNRKPRCASASVIELYDSIITPRTSTRPESNFNSINSTKSTAMCECASDFDPLCTRTHG